MNPISTLALTLAAMTPGDRDKAEFVVLVNCVAHIESGMNPRAEGDGGLAVGAWQMHMAAWITANQWRAAKGLPTIRRGQWEDPKNQRAMGTAYLSWCKEQLVKNGVPNPTPEQIYMAFGWGFSNFKDAGFDTSKAPAHKRDAAERVGNLYRELTK